MNGLYNVRYDDGDATGNTNITADNLRARKGCNFVVDEPVQANWQRYGTWYSGSILAKTDSTFTIGYWDGSANEEDVECSRVRAPACEDEAIGVNRIGGSVAVNWKGRGKCYFGTIADCAGDGRFDILYDDGDKEGSVPADRIQRQSGRSGDPCQ